MIFKKLPNRSEDCDIIWTHDEEDIVKISLKQLRLITICLFEEFQRKNLLPGDTVLLADLLVNNVGNIALLFTALAAYGCRVMLPMWIETKEIENWIQMTNTKAIIVPITEVSKLNNYNKEKQIIKQIINAANRMNILYFDIEKDFKINEYRNIKIHNDRKICNNGIVQKIMKESNPSDEIAIFTTSGTSGRSKLVVYDQKAYINTINSYESTGLYKKGKMLGRTYIDIFPHSVSIRSLINALWTGCPICILTADLIKNKPEKTIPILIEMKPEVIILGPSSFGLIMDYIKMFPEIKKMIFSDLKTIISTGAPYSQMIADEWKKHTELTLHNAYGLIETQQVTSTLLEGGINPINPSIGLPFAGVKIGLEKFDKDTYKLFVKTIFGHKYIINPDKKTNIYPEEYFDTGDIVKIDEKQKIYFIGRENLDYIKNGYGAKIPLTYMKKYYYTLYEKVEHIQYYSPETMLMNLGIAALIFIKIDDMSSGRISNKKVIKKYKKIIKNINYELFKTIEPFEYENRAITRFLLINNEPPKTRKNTISKSKIDMEFEKEVTDLKKCNLKKTGVVNIFSPKQAAVFLLIRLLPTKNFIFRRFLLKIIA